ncbi:hypothetical protein H2199_004268 [Coniosporium tulheliwenetii]|uniref:Uncharacterized protein n=1 Tax=Coniosporium tulheliwenetii TaxID=3383036 RepID=A0ACC2Z7B0_9PEZI|nr:hypothetical protein H2199_004268 [Cladosporium sp. JES 115]
MAPTQSTSATTSPPAAPSIKISSPTNPITSAQERQSSVSSHTSTSSAASTATDDSRIHPPNDDYLSIYHGDLGAERVLSPALSRTNSRRPPSLKRNVTAKSMGGASVATNATSDPVFEIDFEEDDRANPKNWSIKMRGLIIGGVSYSTMTVVLYSTSYTSGIPGMMETFGIGSTTVVVLGLTTYLFGLAVGSVVLAPLSEMYGRRPIYLFTMALFMLLILPCGLAQNLETILITRWFGAFMGAAMIGNAPGTVSDIVSDEHRALAFSIWSIGPMNGPVIGPLIGGFVYEYLGWRWTNWIVMIMSGIAFVIIACIPETYAPAILRRRSKRKKKEAGDSRWWSRYDDKKNFWPLLRVNLSRPFVMTVTEPICIFWDLYIAVIYAILYLCFVAYPIVFSQLRGWSPGLTGLAYCGIGTGSLILIACEPLCRRLINSHAPDPSTGRPPPKPWLQSSASARSGNCAVFIYSSNYLVHSYGIYAASALAGNAVARSVVGGTLPLAGPAMYQALGANWAGTVLGLMEVVLIPIPFVFYKFGSRIREKSALIRSMREDAERLQGKKMKAEEKKKAAGKERKTGAEGKDLESGGVLAEVGGKDEKGG